MVVIVIQILDRVRNATTLGVKTPVKVMIVIPAVIAQVDQQLLWSK